MIGSHLHVSGDLCVLHHIFCHALGFQPIQDIVLILRAIIFALNIVADLPALGIANRLIGGGVGVACALMVLWVLCVIVTLLYVTPPGKDASQASWSRSSLNLLSQESSGLLSIVQLSRCSSPPQVWIRTCHSHDFNPGFAERKKSGDSRFIILPYLLLAIFCGQNKRKY